MCTQHPDSTVKITVQEEVDEAVMAYTMYGCDEVMVDYEGKLTPYSQPKDIVLRAKDAGIVPGEDFYITPRIPNPRLEDVDRMALSLEAALLANYYSMKEFESQAVKWIIVPMVEEKSVIELLQRLIIKKAEALYGELKVRCRPIQLIPLLEDVARLASLHEYVITVLEVMKEFGVNVDELRLFVGKSDAATKSGHIASSLAIRIALSYAKKLESEVDTWIRVIIGMGSPPFRGGLNNLALVDSEVEQYTGYTTATIQSAVRYDVPLQQYVRVRETILAWSSSEPQAISDADSVVKLVVEAEKLYRGFVTKLLPKVVEYARYIPSTRDRVTWKAYGRLFELGDRTLNVPRAIVYTATWYTLGLPPTLLDAPLILELYKQDELDDLLKLLPALRRELEYDSRFYVPRVAAHRLGEDAVRTVNEALDVLGIKPEPDEAYAIMLSLNPIEPHILSLGRMRGFLG